MAKKDKTDISQEINEFQKYLYTPQDTIAESGEYKARMFGKHHDNFLINDFIGNSSLMTPYNFRTRLLQPDIANRYNSKQIKAIEEALYLAANNPMLNKKKRGGMFEQEARSKSTIIHRRYRAKNYDDIQNIYNQYNQGKVDVDKATRVINESIRENAPKDLAVIMRDTSNPQKFTDSPYDGRIVDAYRGRDDIKNILRSIDPEFGDRPIFGASGREEVKGALGTKAENVVRLLASYGYNKQQIVDAMADRDSPLSMDVDIDFLNKLIGQRVMTDREEVYQSPKQFDVKAIQYEGDAEPRTPGYTYFGPGEGTPLGYINPAGERVDTSGNFFNEQRLKELAQAGTPAIEGEGQLVYDKPVYETIDDKEFQYKLSPSVINYIKNNPEAARFFNLEGMEPVDYSGPISRIPVPKASGGRTNYKSGGLTKLVKQKLNK